MTASQNAAKRRQQPTLAITSLARLVVMVAASLIAATGLRWLQLDRVKDNAGSLTIEYGGPWTNEDTRSPLPARQLATLTLPRVMTPEAEGHLLLGGEAFRLIPSKTGQFTSGTIHSTGHGGPVGNFSIGFGSNASPNDITLIVHISGMIRTLPLHRPRPASPS